MMSTALVRTNGARPGVMARMRGAFRMLAGRAGDVTLNGSRGWSIVSGTSPSDYTTTGTTVRTLGWEKHPVVHACARVVADVVAAVPLEPYKSTGATDKDVTVITSGPAVDLLTAPRVGMSRRRLVGLTATHLLVYANAFWVIERQGRVGAPSGLRLVHPEWIVYVYLDSDTEEPVAWEWADRFGRRHRTPYTDMIHFADLAAGDWVWGYPRAAAALQEIVTDSEASQYVRQVVTNDGANLLAVITEGITDPEALAAAERRFHEKRVERGQRGRATFLGGVREVKQLGFNLQQLEFPDLRMVTREDICAAFGVDPRMVGIASAGGTDAALSGDQYSEARFRLIQQTVLPLMTIITDQLDLWLMPEFGPGLSARFSPDRLAELTEDETRTTDRVIKEVQAGLRTREEARPVLGLDAEMDATHTLIGSPARVEYPVAMQFAHAEPGPAPGSAEDGADAAGTDGDGESANDEAPNAPAPPTRARVGGSRLRLRQRGVTLAPEQRDALWRAFDTRAAREESIYRRTALTLFRAEAQQVAQTFQAHGLTPDQDAAIDRIIADVRAGYTKKKGPAYRAWEAQFRALLRETMTRTAEGMAADLGIDFTLVSPALERAIVRRAATLAGYVTETTATDILSAIEAGTKAGMGVKDIARLVQETALGGGKLSARALLIARTETTNALNASEMLTAKESGVIRSKEWLSQRDDRVRPAHQALDGERVPINGTFSNGLEHPGEPNCRCTLLYSDEEAA